MSLLSGLLDHMPPTIAGDDKPTVTKPTTERTRLVMVERPLNCRQAPTPMPPMQRPSGAKPVTSTSTT